ncbi:MAG TPA: VWA domain-containing protein [Candidatus Methanoperedens sp.]|nr:VWA domain-containing protein [Candidatus Methanoperedens sp.]
MSFQYPWLLSLLLLAPGLAFLRSWRRRQPSLAFSDGSTLARLPVTRAVVAHRLLPLLFGLGVVFLVVALARPRTGIEASLVRADVRDIVLLVDVSTSMRAEDLSAAGRTLDRLAAAKEVIGRFIDRRRDDRIGLVAFSALPYTVSPLTLDHGWLVRQLGRLETGMIEDGTAIGDGIASAVNRLRESKAASKVVVLLTDGINNQGVLRPESAARAARALGVRIYAVGAGAGGPVRAPIRDAAGDVRYVLQESGLDETGLAAIADATGGRYFRAVDFAALEEVYAQIDRMEKTRIDTRDYTGFDEGFAPFAILGLFFLLLEAGLGLTRLGRLP